MYAQDQKTAMTINTYTGWWWYRSVIAHPCPV